MIFYSHRVSLFLESKLDQQFKEYNLLSHQGEHLLVDLLHKIKPKMDKLFLYRYKGDYLAFKGKETSKKSSSPNNNNNRNN